MGPKNRLAIVVAIVVLIVGAMFTSFGRNLFALNTPEIALPDSCADSQPQGEGSQTYQMVEVTPQTVSDVVATLSRPSSYYRELSIDLLWAEGSVSTQVQVWSDRGWSHSRQVLPSGAIRHDLAGEDTLYYWYDGSRQYETAPADERTADLAQHIPTYETVIGLDPDEITDAGYETRGDLPCIFVEVRHRDPDLIHRYWVSVDSGLLVSAETLEEGRTVYRMTAYSPVQSPCPSDGEFALPDGTVLHSVSG